jgi:hypothetical protein
MTQDIMTQDIMTYTLVGSRAMKTWFQDAREPKDWDWFCDIPGSHKNFTYMGEPHEVFADERLYAWPWGHTADPDELYTIKISHGHWEVNGPAGWDKHARDIIFLSRKGAQFKRELYDILLPIWKEKYKKNPVSLNKTSDEFFDDAVKRKYQHDSLHESVAYGERPLYESILRDGSDVAVDSSKFRAMDYETQLRLVREEVYATALERILIPRDYKGSPGAAYWWALRRTATSLFKGEWSLFLLTHLDDLRRPDCDYVKRHLANQGRLRPDGGK